MNLRAGTAQVDISPEQPMYLWGYPHAERISTGVNDPLYASVLFLDNGDDAVITIALDLLYITAEDTVEIRNRIVDQMDIDAANIMITCSHTHSGPVTVDLLISGSDPIVPAVDKAYMTQVKNRVVDAAIAAGNSAVEAEVAITSAEIDDVGCNRHDPNDARDPEAGIIVVRDAQTNNIFAVSLIYCMHPTVMHEDSTLISSDFPGYTRKYLQQHLGDDVTVIYHTGPQGNQSPRYHVTGQTFAEAERLGNILGTSVAIAIDNLECADYNSSPQIAAAIETVVPERRTLPSLADAEANLTFRRSEFERLKAENAGHGPIRTAECSVFGAEESVFMASCAENGSLDAALEKYHDFEVQVFRIADTFIVALQGETFVEYSLNLKEKSSAQAFVICCANGETQGYIVTEDATGYEADNALFAPATGTAMVNKAVEMIKKLETGN
ncbi:MAG: neutral/alkaline non-lysosomal ceramidase N-terminal domain-containing protein [Victivallaceae bacterium]|nr:neutral/alkaline non-lysosomal ceramidase N-terminal domain-containing protein [Victivallaceae bacterium]